MRNILFLQYQAVDKEVYCMLLRILIYIHSGISVQNILIFSCGYITDSSDFTSKFSLGLCSALFRLKNQILSAVHFCVQTFTYVQFLVAFTLCWQSSVAVTLPIKTKSPKIFVIQQLRKSLLISDLKYFSYLCANMYIAVLFVAMTDRKDRRYLRRS